MFETAGFPENPLGNCNLPPNVVLFFFRSDRNGENFPIICCNCQFPDSHQPKAITGNRTVNGERHLIRLVSWFWKKNLPLFNYLHQFIPRNGKHPSSRSIRFLVKKKTSPSNTNASTSLKKQTSKQANKNKNNQKQKLNGKSSSSAVDFHIPYGRLSRACITLFSLLIRISLNYKQVSVDFGENNV